MIKNHILHYDVCRMNLSLRLLPLRPECEGRIEYLFYSLNIARDFDDLTDLLERVLACPFTEISREENSILYEVIVDDEARYLKFKVKAAEAQQAA